MAIFSMIILMFIPPEWAKAQDQSSILKMEELNIQVMPEFSYHPSDQEQNHPPLLVGYHGTLMNQTENPQKGKIEIPMPMNDQNFRIGFVADYNRELTEMNEIEYKIDTTTGTIAWETSEEILPGELYKFVIEFYTSSLKVDSEKKTLSYEFTSFADIGLLSLVVLEPLNTDSFKLTPTAESHQQNSYGMNMFVYPFQGIKANETKSFQLEYKRAEEKTSLEMMNEMAGHPANGEGATKKNEILPVSTIIILLASTSIIGGILVFLFLRRKGRSIDSPVSKNNSERKARLRMMLLEGSITEAEYKELLKKIGG
jgi:hypothetical protein